MSRLIFAFGVFCLLQSPSFAANTTTETGGIFFEYNPPPAKSSNEIFVAILEPATGTNVTVAQFMHHLKHTTYATAFMTEIFTLGTGMHLFTDDIMEKPTERDRRIAYVVANKLWASLTSMRTINRLALHVSNETALRYLRNEDRKNTLKYMFSSLQSAILADPALNETYEEEMNSLDLLPLLDFININITKFGSIERTLIKKVWPDSKMFYLIARARFSQHLETEIRDATEFDYENVLLAHLLAEAASVPDLTKDAQKSFDEAVRNVVGRLFDFLRQTQLYDEFDIQLFRSLRAFLRPNVEEKMIELYIKYPNLPEIYKQSIFPSVTV